MVSDRRWTLLFLVTMSTVLGGTIALNVMLDPYGIMRSEYSRQYREPNKRFAKVKYLLQNRAKYDCFLFGSSRVNGIDVTKIPNCSCYNMTYSEGLPQEHYDHIVFLIRSGVNVRRVLIGLDDFSYRVDPADHLNDLLRQPYPEISGTSWLQFYGGYFLRMGNLMDDWNAYRRYQQDHADRRGNRIIYDIVGSGRSLCLNCDEAAEQDPDAYRREPRFFVPFHYDGDNSQAALEAMRRIVRLSRERHFELIVFINPVHHVTYRDTDLELMARFKSELAAITPYYDFSGLNSITTDNYFYHETSHYRQLVGDMMLARMMGINGVSVPDDFGVRVTNRTVRAHLGSLRRQIEKTMEP